MRVLFAGQVPKDPSFPEAIEDSIELAPEIGRIALSDGASESFDSKKWAQILARQFVRDPTLNKEWLAGLVAEYQSQVDLSGMSWSKQAAFERGSFATLLGIENLPNHCTVNVLSVGDSLAILLDKYELIDSYPYSCAHEFQQSPELFCTSASHNSFFMSAGFFSNHHKTWNISGKKFPTLLCMTDALGEWALGNAQDGKPAWERLCSIDSVPQLEALVFTERENKKMRIDDVTIIRIEFDRVENHGLPHA